MKVEMLAGSSKVIVRHCGGLGLEQNSRSGRERKHEGSNRRH